MYFPILRGRQFELIALRELVEKDLIGSKVIPIIEPVKPSSTLISTLGAYREKNADVAVIRNPRAGDMISQLNDSENNDVRDRFFEEISKNRFISTFYVDDKDGVSRNSLEEKDINPEQSIAICLNKDSIHKYSVLFGTKGALFTIMTDERAIRRAIPGKKVILSDNFKKKIKNTEYLLNEDEPFTEDNVYYMEEGFSGFSDYSVIGKEYNETGFAPYAVAIHIVFHDIDQSLRIHHFVSDSNETINDPAGKFSEALSKFHDWNKIHKLTTWASGELERLYQNGEYPGLGTIKKLSIMHHLELVNQYLEGVSHDHL